MRLLFERIAGPNGPGRHPRGVVASVGHLALQWLVRSRQARGSTAGAALQRPASPASRAGGDRRSRCGVRLISCAGSAEVRRSVAGPRRLARPRRFGHSDPWSGVLGCRPHSGIRGTMREWAS
jgi:hypothetical protein